jgi:hypothetical protein
MQKLVLFTFDYELFLGNRSGTVKDCILDPTRRLLGLFQDFGYKAIFFIDTVYLMRLQEIAAQYPEASADSEALQQQLTAIAQQGHFLFPHIHPHWLDAVYLPAENQWSLNNTRYYQFSSLLPAQQQALFQRSVEMIRSIVRPVMPDHKIDGYRAGGWSIQPFSHFRPYFLQYGISHEWSVIPGKYQLSDAHAFDFRTAPSQEPIYHFDKDVCLKEKKGPFTEWTISCLSINRFERWFDFKVSGLLRRIKGREPLKGSTVTSVIREEGDAWENKDHIRMIASFESLNPFRLLKYKAAIRKSCYFHFISHPKMMSAYDFSMVEKLLRSMRKCTSIETDFRKAVI